MKRLVVALDWTPNTNHVGFFLAQHLGLYRQAGLDVELRSPDSAPAGAVRVTPARQVADGTADFGIGPSESAISFATTQEPEAAASLVVVAALLQRSTSSICTLQASGIDSPVKLEGKRYATYGGRFEDAIVAKMVDHAGGDGSRVQFVPLAFHGYEEAVSMRSGSVVRSHLEANQADATWIFSHVEGVLAQRAGEALHEFRLEDYHIPYGYHPVLLTRRSALSDDTARAFMRCTAEGYTRAAAHPTEAAAALTACGHPAVADAAFVVASASAVADKILTADGKWGVMEAARWTAFVDFLVDAKAIKDRQGNVLPRSAINDAALFSNMLLTSE